MASIAFVLWPEIGHFLPALKLAKRLKERGHRVVTMGIADFAPVVPSPALDFVPVGSDVFPKGSLRGPNPAHGIVEDRANYRRFLSLFRRPGLFDGIDLLVADALLPMVAIAGHGAGVRVATLHFNLPYTREDGLPPVITSLLPPRTAAERLRTELEWHRSLFLRRAGERIAASLWNWPDERRLLAEHAAGCGYPPGDINAESSIGFRLAFPELILCPEEFDLPHPPRENRYYIEPSIDFERPEAEFPWPLLDPDKRLLVCTVGTQGHLYRTQAQILALFRSVVQAARDRPDVQLVLCSTHDPASLGPLPEGAIVRPRLPYISLMKRANLVITHGGIGSIKEPLYFGVPLIVFPLRLEQPGNAARVVYHGIGVQGDIRRASPEAVDALLRSVESDPTIRQRAGAMGRRFAELEAEGRGAAMLAGLAEGVVDYRLVSPTGRGRAAGRRASS
jgi:zeaxanthin glucosyltransferase